MFAYLQYFLGLSEYRDTPLFDPSMMVHFRCRFEQADFTRINEAIIESARSRTGETGGPDSDPDDPGGEAPIVVKFMAKNYRPAEYPGWRRQLPDERPESCN